MVPDFLDSLPTYDSVAQAAVANVKSGLSFLPTAERRMAPGCGEHRGEAPEEGREWHGGL